MSRSEAIKVLKDMGYDAVDKDNMVYVYHNEEDSLGFHFKIGEILADAGYECSYGTCGREKKDTTD